MKDIINEKEIVKIKEHLSRIEVLNDIYDDLSKTEYSNRQERDLGKLKMNLAKKEMLLLCYLIDKEISRINPG